MMRTSFLLPFLLAAPAAAQISISEIRIDQSGNDDDEFFELVGPAGFALTGYTYLVIGDGATGSGTIEAVIDLSTSAIPASGYFVGADTGFTLATADLTTGINFENGDNVTHLLVQGFTGSNGDDLDTDDDGVLDVTPWGLIADCIALIQDPKGGDQVYCAETLGPDGMFVPAHAFNGCTDGWQIGAFALGEQDTPGASNTPSCRYGTASCQPVANSTGNVGVLNQVNDNIAGNAIEFSVSDCPPGEMGYFFAARNAGLVMNPSGSLGNLCAVSDTARFISSMGMIDGNGDYSAVLDTSAMPNTPTVSAMSGETWTFQFWHRDGTDNNFTDSLELTFE